MQGAGLRTLVDYESLPVSGFGDILPRYLKLRNSFSILKATLKDPLCKGFVAVDYPGFNMKLIKFAGMLRKPCLYVAPPQVWAWKKKRAVTLSEIKNTKLAVLFPFEKVPYEEAGCKVSLLQHPFVESTNSNLHCEKKGILLLPGSREKQMCRNIPVFLNVAKSLPGERFVFVVARQTLVPKMENEVRRFFKGKIPDFIKVLCAPAKARDRSEFYRKFKAALSAPGTATLELSLSGVPLIVATKPDVLTYHLGRQLVKIPNYALPNIILGKNIYPEFICRQWNALLYRQVAKALKDDCAAGHHELLEKDLRQKLSDGLSPDNLMSEFLAQFL